jgi:putative flippase GtrA
MASSSSKAWAFKSVAINATGSLLDLCVLMIFARVIKAPLPVAAFLGAATGASFNFFVNRRLAFSDSQLAFGSQALRYAACTLGLLLLHAAFVTFLHQNFAVPLPVAKFTSDFCVMAGAQLVLLRFVVFPRGETSSATARVAKPAEA